MTLSIDTQHNNTEWHYAQCRNFCNIILSLVMLNDMLNDLLNVMLSVAIINVVWLCDMAP